MRTLTSLTLLLWWLCSSGCTPIRQQAERASARGEYAEAATLYGRLYRQTMARDSELRGYYAWHTAESYRQLRSRERAFSHYLAALRYGYPDSLVLLRLGQQAQSLGLYDEAEAYYLRYRTSTPDSYWAHLGLAGCRLARTDSLGRYVVQRAISLGSIASDYAPAYSADGYTLYLTSHRHRPSTEQSAITGEGDANIYSLGRSAYGTWMARIDTLRGELNTSADEGTPSLSPDGAYLYYSYAEARGEVERTAHIYRARSAGEAGWNRGHRLDVWRDSTTLATHPSLSPSGRMLFFVSDRVGGTGGKDLYAVPLEGDEVGTPYILAELNTLGDELFPYASSDSTLYFASDGRVGYGGLDIYRAMQLPSGRWHVEHLPRPINSPADDYGVAIDPRTTEKPGDRSVVMQGLLSSSRDDSRGRPHLYEFVLHERITTIEGYVLDREEYPIAGATVRLVGRIDNGREHITATRDDGSYRLEAQAGVEYVMLASAKGYLNQYARLTTDSTPHDDTYSVEFFLASSERAETLSNVHYAFDSSDLLPESTPALAELLRILTDNPDIVLQLSAHADRYGAEAYNQALSERRARSVVRYLVEHGVDSHRLVAIGCGQSQPIVVSAGVARQYPFLSEGEQLTPERIGALTPEQQALCDALNRRTEFAVLRRP